MSEQKIIEVLLRRNAQGEWEIGTDHEDPEFVRALMRKQLPTDEHVDAFIAEGEEALREAEERKDEFEKRIEPEDPANWWK